MVVCVRTRAEAARLRATNTAPDAAPASAADTASAAPLITVAGAAALCGAPPPVSTPPTGRDPTDAPITMPQLVGAVASWGSFGSSSLLPAPSKSYLPFLLRSIPCCTMCRSLRWSTTACETVIVRLYETLPCLFAMGMRSTARPLVAWVSPIVVSEMLMSP